MSDRVPDSPTPSSGSGGEEDPWTAATPDSGQEATGLWRPDGHSPRDSGSPVPGLSREELLERFPLREGGRYEPLDVLGEGGMGVVYKVLDNQLQRTVAIKLLKRLEPEDTERFLQEARAQAQVEHPNVCRIFEAGESHGHPFLVMQFVDGPTLREACHSLTLRQKVDVLLQTAEALHACHRVGIVHRDVKPGNVMLQREENSRWQAFLMDFGVARDLDEASRTHTYAIMGTPMYLSPEQALGRGDKVDRRSDVYALGTLLYECLTGTPPFQGRTPLALMRSIAEDEPLPPSRLAPDISRDLQTIILKALEKDPARRYDSARAFGEDLRRFLEGDPILARRPSLAYQASKRLRKNRPLALTLSLLLAASAYAIFSSLRARSQVRFAQQLAQEVEHLDGRIFQVRSLPRHNASQELQEVRSELTHLQAETEKQGRWAQGPARLALGRGFLALGDLGNARTQLEIARKATPSDPDTAQALGTTLALIYVEELDGLHGQTLLDRRRELEPALRAPALALLREAKGRSLEGAAYAEGLLDLVQGHFEEALARAKEAQIKQPWFPEPWLLEGQIRKERVMNLLSQGKWEEAQGEIDLEGACLAAAQDRARSAPEPLVEEAQRRFILLGWKIDQGHPSPTIRDWALEPVQQALEVAPDSWRALSFGTAIHRRWATYLQAQGNDPSGELDAAASDAEKALSIKPSEATLWVNWATVLRNRAERTMGQGGDPEPFLDRAEVGLQKALQQPRLHDYLLDALGNLHALRGQRQLLMGKDPSKEIQAAAMALEAASSLRPWVGHDFSEGGAYQTLAHFQIWNDLDPTSALEKALQCHRRGLALQPSSLQSRLGLISALLDRARWEIDQVKPASSDLGEARKEIAIALAAHPESADALAASAQERFLTSQAIGKPALADQALALQRRALHQSPHNMDLQLAWADMALSASRIHGTPLQPDIAPALRALAKARPWDGWAQLLAGELAMREGHPDTSRRLVLKALSINPSLRGEITRRGLQPASA